MCGIFGIAVRENAAISKSQYSALLERLYALSESRGKESAGLHILLPAAKLSWRIKGAVPASELLQSTEFRDTFSAVLDRVYESSSELPKQPLIAMAHSRLVTNGRAEKPENNQPVRSGFVSVVHNGIVVNVEELWSTNRNLQRSAEVDTEVIAALLDESMRAGSDPHLAMCSVFRNIRGAASIAWTCSSLPYLSLATNTGDLFVTSFRDETGVAFASERFILETAVRNQSESSAWSEVRQLRPGMSLAVTLDVNTAWSEIEMNEDVRPFPNEGTTVISGTNHVDIEIGRQARKIELCEHKVNFGLLRYNESAMRELPRCSRCVLPNTFPFITFDAQGVCNYCHGYKRKFNIGQENESKEQFLQTLEVYRRNQGQPDVLVPFSGGRDSCYGLHLIKNEFGLNPITFTYDWGMVTDLARRNIARMCGQLGVQNILVSADIRAKRDNIRKNVSAWLKRPDLGIVPLFMAGDKHFHVKLNELKRQTGIQFNIWSVNPLENTDFKVGLCGVRPNFSKGFVDQLSLVDKIKLLAYYGRGVLMNPRYLNTSLSDTASAYASYYIEPRHHYYSLFHHVVWDESIVNKVICGQYDFERAVDSTSTWRIGDGTAPFYNYIYMTARGFTEFDTFRSNQIREGQIRRQEAMDAILVENRPRAEGLQWYFETVGIEFDAAIKAVNALDVMGLHG